MPIKIVQNEIHKVYADAVIGILNPLIGEEKGEERGVVCVSIQLAEQLILSFSLFCALYLCFVMLCLVVSGGGDKLGI